LAVLASTSQRDPVGVVGLVLSCALVSAALVRVRSRRASVMVLASALTLITALTVIYLVRAEARVAHQLFGLLPPLHALRSPPRWYPVLTYSICTLAAASLERIRRALGAGTSLAVAALLLGTALAHGWRILDADGVLRPRTIKSAICGAHDVFYGYVPDYLLEAGEKLTRLREQEPFRVLWVPLDSMVYQVVSVLDPSGVYPILSPTHQELLVELAEELRNGSGGMGDALAALGVKYVVVLKRVNQTCGIGVYRSPLGVKFLVGEPAKYLDALSRQEGLAVVVDTRDYAVLLNKAFVGVVVASYELPRVPAERGLLTRLCEVVRSAREAAGLRVELLEYSMEYFQWRYVVRVSADRPAYVVLLQSYHPLWRAYLLGGDGGRMRELPHCLALGWANGYALPGAGDYVVEIVFEGELRRVVLVSAWVGALAFTAAALLACCLSELARGLWRPFEVCLIGVDGSGKTTHATRLSSAMRKLGLRVTCEHAFSSTPSRSLGVQLQLLNALGRGLAQWTSTPTGLLITDVLKVLVRGLSLAAFWWLKRIRARLIGSHVIVYDRCHYDSLVLLAASHRALRSVALALSRLLPKPDLVVLTWVSPATARERRGGSLTELALLASLYGQLGRELGDLLLDTERQSVERSSELLLMVALKSYLSRARRARGRE